MLWKKGDCLYHALLQRSGRFPVADWLRLALPYFHWREIRSEYTVIERPDGYMVSQSGEEMFGPKLTGEFSFMKKDGTDVD